jgi:hypothetical protein
MVSSARVLRQNRRTRKPFERPEIELNQLTQMKTAEVSALHQRQVKDRPSSALPRFLKRKEGKRTGVLRQFGDDSTPCRASPAC